MEPVPVLSIAGFDPAAGAGILADIRVFNALGLYGMAVVTAVTAQNTAEITGVYPLEGDTVTTQIETLITDIPPAAAKTGMLASEAAVGTVAAFAIEGRSEEHTSELQSHSFISYAVFCLKKKKN